MPGVSVLLICKVPSHTTKLTSLHKDKQDFFNMERRNGSYSWEERGGHLKKESPDVF